MGAQRSPFVRRCCLQHLLRHSYHPLSRGGGNLSGLGIGVREAAAAVVAGPLCLPEQLPFFLTGIVRPLSDRDANAYDTHTALQGHTFAVHVVSDPS
jgi:hypothetical protein